MNNYQNEKEYIEQECCPLCGNELPADPGQRIIGATGRSICMSCLRVANVMGGLDNEPEDREGPFDSIPVPAPSQVLSELSEVIIGQDEAKRAVVMALWKQMRRRNGDSIPNASLLLYGPTGCGKTALIREAARIMGLPFIAADATAISETGYRGKDASDIVVELVKQCGSVEKASYAVVFVDEFDKLGADPSNDYRASHSRGTQYSFLKLIEGVDVQLEDGVINTSNILFLFGGAFSKLTQRGREKCERKTVGFLRETQPETEEVSAPLTPEDFVTLGGMEPELMGRVGRCVPLSPLTEEDMLAILYESKLSAFRRYQVYFRNRGKTLCMSETDAKELVQKALARGMGARGLNALIEEWVEPHLVALAEAEYGDVGA